MRPRPDQRLFVFFFVNTFETLNYFGIFFSSKEIEFTSTKRLVALSCRQHNTTKKKEQQEKNKHGIIVRVAIVDVHRASSYLLLLLFRDEKVRANLCFVFSKFSRLSFPFFDISLSLSDASSLLPSSSRRGTDRRRPDDNRSFAPLPLRKTPMRHRRRRRRNWCRPTPLPSRYARLFVFLFFSFCFSIAR
jgi:hypothetical protein